LLIRHVHCPSRNPIVGFPACTYTTAARLWQYSASMGHRPRACGGRWRVPSYRAHWRRVPPTRGLPSATPRLTLPSNLPSAGWRRRGRFSRRYLQLAALSKWPARPHRHC
jgi:hypothetical protein